jgi:D-beta-D-heptose 7-phosphate kinase/D-beta-D-heptose 1-phosphate adenosyltransferase
MYDRLLKLVNNVGAPKVLLIGDFMLDRYLYGFTDRISPEAPVMVLNVNEREVKAGGCGSVAVDLSTLGCEVTCVGMVGDDLVGRELKEILDNLDGVNGDGIVIVNDRPTTSKERIIGLAQHRHQQQLMRIDEESCLPVSDKDQAIFIAFIKQTINDCDVVCLEDYNKGMFKGDFCTTIIEIANASGKRVLVDPAAIQDYSRYRGCWMIKPNRREVTMATGVEINDETSCLVASKKLATTLSVENIVVTLDKQGAYLYNKTKDAGEMIPTKVRDVYDVTGAGDMVLATLGLLAGGQYSEVDMPTGSEIVAVANVAGGLEVERYGCVGISRDEIIAELIREGKIETGKLRTLPALLEELKLHRRHDKKIVFTNGCFDILHSGHIALINFAKSVGDLLIMGINSDASVARLKGPDRPINNHHDRSVLLSALESVDYVIVFEDDTPLALIEAIIPDILIKGSDWTGNVVGQECVEAGGGKVVLMPLIEGKSTTATIEQVIKNKH